MDVPLKKWLEEIRDEDCWSFFRSLRVPEYEIQKHQACCLSDETKFQALKKVFETDKRSFINKFGRYLTETTGSRNVLRSLNDRFATSDFIPDEITSGDYYRIIDKVGRNWPRFARTQLKLKDEDIVRYGDFELTMETKIQMSLDWIRKEGQSEEVFVEKIRQFLRQNNAEILLKKWLQEIRDEYYWLFFRDLRMPEYEIQKHQACCLSNETKFQGLKKVFETDKRSFINKFGRYLTETTGSQNILRSFNDRFATSDFIPDEISSGDYYRILDKVGRNWPRFARTQLKLKDEDIVRYGDFELTMETKIQMSLHWIRKEGQSEEVFVEKIRQFLRQNNAGDDSSLFGILH